MPDILSQSQIDELLSELSSGDASEEDISIEASAKKIKEYDFKSPKKLSKEQLKLLASIYENFARHLASYFSGILREYCSINVNSIEEQPYFEYNNALPDAVLIGVLDAKPIEGAVLVDISNSISFFLIERLLGGSGEVTMLDREFTEIEVGLMEPIFDHMAAFMKEAWSHFYEIDASMKMIETNSRLIQSMAMDEVVAIIVLDVSIGETKGMITFCIPCASVESIIEKTSHSQYTPKRKVDIEQDELLKEAMIAKIKKSSIEMCGIFGSTLLTINEITNLQVGDVIKLDQGIDSSVALNVHGKTWFYGIPGIKKNKKVIKINKVF